MYNFIIYLQVLIFILSFFSKEEKIKLESLPFPKDYYFLHYVLFVDTKQEFKQASLTSKLTQILFTDKLKCSNNYITVQLLDGTYYNISTLLNLTKYTRIYSVI